MMIPWAAMILQSIGVDLSPAGVPSLLKWVSLGLWISGFGILLVVGASVAAVHYRIILAEEECLRKIIGREYDEYCQRVRRYL